MTIEINNHFGCTGLLSMDYREQLSALGIIYSGFGSVRILNAAKDKNLRPIALFHASGAYPIEVLNEIYNLGVDLSEKDNSGTTLGTACLFSAISYSNYDIKNLQFFLDKGVPINSKDSHGRTALMLAVANYEFNAAKFLIANGCDIECFDNKGSAAIGYLWTDNADLARTLITPNTIKSKSVYTCGKPLREHFSQLGCLNVLKFL